MRKLWLLSFALFFLTCGNNTKNSGRPSDDDADTVAVESPAAGNQRKCIGEFYLGMTKTEYGEAIAELKGSPIGWYDLSFTVDEAGTTFYHDTLAAISFTSNIAEQIPDEEKKTPGRLDHVTNQYRFICNMIGRQLPQASTRDDDATPADLLRTFDSGDWYLQVHMKAPRTATGMLNFQYQLSYHYEALLKRIWAEQEAH